MIMRQEGSKDVEAGAPQAAAALLEAGSGSGSAHEKLLKPSKLEGREAAEAFENPDSNKIDDSFGSWSPHMPAFVEEAPWFYATAFVGGALVFLLFVCFYVQYEDSKDQEKSEQLRNVALRRAAASAAMGVPRMGSSYAPQPSPATIRIAAEAVANAASRSQPPMPEQLLAVAAPKARAAAAARAAGTAASAVQAAEDSMTALTNSMGNFTGMLAGENVGPGKRFGSPDLSTASGASSPRSTSTHSAHSRPVKNQGICNGSVLIAHVHEAIFASSESWQEIGQLTPGQQVIAAGPPEVMDAYTMVPIKPRGAVDLKTLVVHEY